MSHILAMLAVSTVSALSTDSATNPSGNGSETQGMTTAEPLPSPGTINAWQFLAIAAGANVPWSCEATPATHTTPKLGAARDGMKRAIAAYCGFNDALPFGEQEHAARVKAQREIAPAMGRPVMAPRPSFTVVGLVAGMPDEQGKLVRNVQARLRLAKQAADAFGMVTNPATFAVACREHLVDAERAESLISLVTPEGVLNDAARLKREHEELLSKLSTELSALFA